MVPMCCILTFLTLLCRGTLTPCTGPPPAGIDFLPVVARCARGGQVVFTESSWDRLKVVMQPYVAALQVGGAMQLAVHSQTQSVHCTVLRVC
jgi:hypothetical protein